LLDSRVYGLNPELIEALSAPGTSDLFAWLRNAHTSDGNFQASVEMAMGKSELETPPELWISPDEIDVTSDDEDNAKHGHLAETGEDGGTDGNNTCTATASVTVIAASEVASASRIPSKDTPAALTEEENKGSSTVKQRNQMHGPRGGNNRQEVGRPDEAKLSMLAAVRTRFHRLLFRESSDDNDAPCHSPLEFDSIPHALNYLHFEPNTSASPSSTKATSSATASANAPDTTEQFSGADASMIDAIKACVAVRLPLAELLDDESDDTAPNRLTALLQPAWRAVWVVEASCASSSLKGADDSAAAVSGRINSSSNISLGSAVRLEYEIPRNKGRTVRGSQSLGELSEFQV